MKKPLEAAYPIVLGWWIDNSIFLKVYPEFKPKYEKKLKEIQEKRNENH